MKPSTTHILILAGIGPHYQGYKYLLKAIQLIQSEPDALNQMDTLVYSEIARFYHTSNTNVSKNIRSVRDVFMRNHGAEILYKLTGSRIWYHNVPYPRELIAILAQYTTM